MEAAASPKAIGRIPAIITYGLAEKKKAKIVYEIA
jgi:hypothetical protein